MPVPNQFANVTTSIPLSQLDANFNTPITLGNTAIQLGNTVTTLNNMTLANVTISSGNVTITNVSVTTANVATANVTTSQILNYGTANSVQYLNTSKALTSDANFVYNATGLGIGASLPAQKLSVIGNIALGTDNTNQSCRIQVADTSAQATDARFLFRNGTDTNAALRLVLNSANVVQMDAVQANNSSTTKDLIFQTNGGNMGLGYSSPRSVANYRTLAVGGASNGGLLDMVNVSGAVLGTWYSDSTGSLTINADPNGSFSSSSIQFQVDGSERARITSGGNFEITNGNLVIGTSGKGIDFSATPGTGTSELLADYEEGTWTPSLGGNTTYALRVGKYTKIGNIVTVYCALTVSLIGTGSTTTISGLPFTVDNRGGGGMSYWGALSQSLVYLSPYGSGTTVAFIGATAASAGVTDGIAIFKNDAYVIFELVYQAA